jgi:hypothetical protein
MAAYPFILRILARISHHCDEKFARRVFTEFPLTDFGILQKGLSFVPLLRDKTLSATLCGQSGFLSKRKIDEKTGLGKQPAEIKEESSRARLVAYPI